VVDKVVEEVKRSNARRLRDEDLLEILEKVTNTPLQGQGE
jgi:hypothetical protein